MITDKIHAARVRRRVRQLSFADATTRLRHSMLGFGTKLPREEEHELAKHARDTALVDWQREFFARLVDITSRPGETKVATGHITSIDGVPLEIIDEINEIEENLWRRSTHETRRGTSPRSGGSRPRRIERSRQHQRD